MRSSMLGTLVIVPTASLVFFLRVRVRICFIPFRLTLTHIHPYFVNREVIILRLELPIFPIVYSYSMISKVLKKFNIQFCVLIQLYMFLKMNSLYIFLFFVTCKLKELFMIFINLNGNLQKNMQFLIVIRA